MVREFTTTGKGLVWTTVVFRRWANGDIIALFPKLDHDNTGRFCVSYEHIGQHGAAHYSGVISRTEPATEEQAEPLLRELQSIGYRLTIRKRR